MEQYVADNMEQESLNNTNPQLEKQLQDLQAQIDDSKEVGTAPQAVVSLVAFLRCMK